MIQTVQQVYADFGKQNVPGVLNSLTDDISWSDPGSPGIPYAKQRNGKKASRMKSEHEMI